MRASPPTSPTARSWSKLGQGVTEVTIVNIAVGPGWFEICKSGARDGEEFASAMAASTVRNPIS